MHNEFTAVIEKDGPWYISYCPEIPGANGQGRTKDECLESLREAVRLILEDRREQEKGDGSILCEAPEGPFRQNTPVPFFQ